MGDSVLFFTQAYNAEKTLTQTIESVLNQTHENLKYLIHDNGSTDATGAIVDDWAKRDARVIPYHTEVNRFGISQIIWKKITDKHRGAKYYAHIDADDTYDLDFAKKMIAFMGEHHLDCAACGTRLVELSSGKLIRKRVLEKDFIIERDRLADDFLIYRRYFIEFWGKIYTTDLLRGKGAGFNWDATGRSRLVDFNLTLSLLRHAERAGILAQCLHTYNQREDSACRDVFAGIDAHLIYWISSIRNYLLLLGPISEINRNYLHAIYLGQLSDTLDLIYRAAMLTTDKFQLILDILQLQDTQDMLQCRPNPQFRNLTERRAFLQNIKDWVVAQEDVEGKLSLREGVLELLDGFIKKQISHK